MFDSVAKNEAAIIAALSLVVVAIVTAVAAYLGSKRDRRRQLYGEAYRTALMWREMLYRVRRRQMDRGPELVERFHELQEQIDYYSGWIGSESRWLQRSYLRLISSIKAATGPLIAEAWETEPTAETRQWRSLAADDHPNVTAEGQRFLLDVRGHLSPLQVRKIWVIMRNRD
jgi:hypothetical protein